MARGVTERKAAFLDDSCKCGSRLFLKCIDFIQISHGLEPPAELAPPEGRGFLFQKPDDFVIFQFCQSFLIHKFTCLFFLKSFLFLIFYPALVPDVTILLHSLSCDKSVESRQSADFMSETVHGWPAPVYLRENFSPAPAGYD